MGFVFRDALRVDLYWEFVSMVAPAKALIVLLVLDIYKAFL